MNTVCYISPLVKFISPRVIVDPPRLIVVPRVVAVIPFVFGLDRSTLLTVRISFRLVIEVIQSLHVALVVFFTWPDQGFER